MKRSILSTLLLVLGVVWASGISPYLKLNSHDGPMNEAVGQVESILEDEGYEILGRYQPAGNPDLYVLVFTSDELIGFCQKVEDRGLLAAAMKVGFQKTEGKIAVSMINPEYLFYAYFQEKMNNEAFKTSALRLSDKVKGVLADGTRPEPFGGDTWGDIS